MQKKICLVSFILFVILFSACARQQGTLPDGELPVSQQIPATELSYLNICSFAQDSLGYMWIATLRGLNRYNGYEYFHYFHDETDLTSIDHDFVFSVFIDSSHRLWVGTATGLNRYDFGTNRFIRYSNPEGLSFCVYNIYEDRDGKIWLATPAGPGWVDTENGHMMMDLPLKSQMVKLFREDDAGMLWMGLEEDAGLAVLRQDGDWEYYTLPGNRRVLSVFGDPGGLWWLGTNSGVILFDHCTRTFRDPPRAFMQNNRLGRSAINFIHETGPRKLLIGTDSEGIFQYELVSGTLTHNEPARLNERGSSEILSGFIDRQNNVWVGTYDKGFGVWNSGLDYFNADPVLSNLLRDKFVTRVIEDRYGNLWIGTRYHGLYHYTTSGQAAVYDAGSDIFNGNITPIESLFIDSRDRIWIGLEEDLVEGTVSAQGDLRITGKRGLKQVRIMREDGEGNLWIGSAHGLFRMGREGNHLREIYQYNIPDVCILRSGDILFSAYGQGIFLLRKNGAVPQPYTIPEQDARSVANNCVTLTEDSQGRIWLGSYGYGMLYTDGTETHVFRQSDGLPSNNVLSFEEDDRGDMWMSTSYGIARFRIKGNAFTNYSESDGTLGNQYHEKAGLKHSDGRIYFGGNHGLTFFNPSATLPPKDPPIVHIQDLRVLNHNVQPTQQGLPLSMSIAFADNITLNHRQSIFSLDYTGIEFLSPDKLSYAYMLEGFDKTWNHVGNFRRATYSNLPAGRYTFYVKAINDEGTESLRPASLHITIKPAPWYSWQAWLLYVMAFTASAGFLIRLIFKAKINRQMLEMEHSEREREREVTEMKINFFTNISHELRTPLTLISAPLEQLSAQTDLNPRSRSLTHTISRNVQNMLRLINQLLDFRKMEQGILSLGVQQEDIVRLTGDIRDVFQFQAQAKKAELVFSPSQPSREMWVDTDKLEKILHNLLSNALKHLPEKGKVVISICEVTGPEAAARYTGAAQDRTYIEISVTDNGPGIPEDRMGELFVRYRQIDSASGHRPDYGGTGIGLHYTKRLVETHYGRIIARNRPEGGMAFSFILPAGDIYKESEKKSRKDVMPPVLPAGGAGPDTPAVQKHPYTILVAEDNPDLMEFIHNLLGERYGVIEASDGVRAWESAQSGSPDLILSDVLMPGMTGYELCAKVKGDPALSHIPVILLTAKSTVFDQVEGLEQGADAYICKPFHVEYLLLTIKNLLMGRDRLRQYYSSPQVDERLPIPVELNIFDRRFMDKLTAKLEQEMANPELNIDAMARDLGFSRTGFYRKIKGLTDMAPNDFLKSYRLRRAAEMIIGDEWSLGEVADNTGFSSYSYFSKSFKKHFGVSPREYVGSPATDKPEK